MPSWREIRLGLLIEQKEKLQVGIPFLDLNSYHAPLKEFEHVISKVIDTGTFTDQPFVEKFEEELASQCGCHPRGDYSPFFVTQDRC